jgi:hypothetical protein
MFADKNTMFFSCEMATDYTGPLLALIRVYIRGYMMLLFPFQNLQKTNFGFFLRNGYRLYRPASRLDPSIHMGLHDIISTYARAVLRKQIFSCSLFCQWDKPLSLGLLQSRTRKRESSK